MRRPVAWLRASIIARNRDFGLLWTGGTLSSAGSWMMQVAVPLQVYKLTGSTRDAGLTVVAEVVPLLLLSPVGGVVADRFSRQRIMIAADLAQAGCVSALLLAGNRSQLWLIMTAIGAENCGAAFFGPAWTALQPAVVGRGADLGVASSWLAFSSGVVRLAGAPLGGALFAAEGFQLPVTLDAASFLVSALLVGLMRRPRSDQPRPPSAVGLRDAIAVIRGDRVLRVLLGAYALFLLGNGGLTALLVPYLVSGLRAQPATVGALFSALGVGYLASAYVGRLACASVRLRRTVATLLAVAVLAFTGLFDLHASRPAFVFIALAGLGGGAFLMLEQTLVQRRTPDRLCGRVAAVYATTATAATLVGALLGSLLAGGLGRSSTLNVAIGVIAAGATLALRLPARSSAESC